MASLRLSVVSSSKHRSIFMSTPIKVSLDSSNSSQKQTILTEKRTEIASFVEQPYRPNFVLRPSSGVRIISVSSSASAVTFGDILPFYPSRVQLVDFIILTREGLIDFLLKSRALFVCIFSLFNQLVNNLAYQTYLISVAGYDQISTLPEKYAWLKREFAGIIETFSSAQTRELWWLGLQVEVRVYVDKLLASLDQSLLVLRKFYLAAFVFVCLSVLFVAGQSNNLQADPSQSRQSTLSRFIGNQSLVITQFRSQDFSDLEIAKLSLESLNKSNSEASQLTVVFEHQVAENETVSKIATFYGLKPETVRFNNNLADNQEPKVGDKFYLPWSDGYIYRAEDTVDPDYLADLYGVKAEDIVLQNKGILNFEKKRFEKGSLVLIPTDDYGKVAQANLQEEARKENLRRAEEERQRMNSWRAPFGNTYRGVTSDQARSEGFIWPTTGRISRCVEWGHIACDIANPSAPPIFAVQDGVVAKIGYEHRGYGNYIIIDHGGGLKTLYAHMSEIYVVTGQKVKQGISIARMGCVGWCTGTHLHFEVIQDGVKQDPLLYLP